MALTSRCLPGNIDDVWLWAVYWLTALFTVISGLHYMAKGVALINRTGKE